MRAQGQDATSPEPGDDRNSAVRPGVSDCADDARRLALRTRAARRRCWRPRPASAATSRSPRPTDGNAACTGASRARCAPRSPRRRRNGSTADDMITVPGRHLHAHAGSAAADVPRATRHLDPRRRARTTTIIQPRRRVSDRPEPRLGVERRAERPDARATARSRAATAATSCVRRGADRLLDASGSPAARAQQRRRHRGRGRQAGTLDDPSEPDRRQHAPRPRTPTSAAASTPATATGSTTMIIQDSTITGNQRAAGGAIAPRRHRVLTLSRGVTRRPQHARRGNPGGAAASTRVVDVDALPGLDRRLQHRRRPAASIASQLLASLPTDDGGNVESGTDCGFTTRPAEHRRAALGGARHDRGPARAHDPGDEPGASTSPSAARARSTSAASPRPQGARCDAGAFEYKAPDPDADAHTDADAASRRSRRPRRRPRLPTPTPTPVFHTSVVGARGQGHDPRPPPGQLEVRGPRPERGDPAGLDRRRPQGHRRDHVGAQGGRQAGEGAVLRRDVQDHPAGAITTLALTEPLAACTKGKAQRGGHQAEDAPAVGRRQGQVPHQGPLQRGHRPRHQVARRRTAAPAR